MVIEYDGKVTIEIPSSLVFYRSDTVMEMLRLKDPEATEQRRKRRLKRRI